MTHAVSVPLSELSRGSQRVSRVTVRRVFDGAEPSSVTFAPHELRPFELRYRFWRVVDEERDDADPLKWRWWMPGAPETIAPSEFAEWTSEHARTLAANFYAYRRYAEGLLDGRARRSLADREGMLSLTEDDYTRMRADDLPDIYLLALTREVEARRESGDGLQRIATELGMSRKTLYLRRREAERRGLR